MKLFIFLFLLTSYSLQAQIVTNYSVDYSGFNLTEGNKKGKSNAFIKTYIIPAVDIINNSIARLEICDGISFLSMEKSNSDLNTNNPIAEALLAAETWYTVDEEAASLSKKKNRLIVADYNKNDWKIVDSDRKILGYQCLKATKTLYSNNPNFKPRLLEVWFTTELPYNSGFRDATVLPGLILGYNDQVFEFYALSIEVDNKCELNIPNIDKISFTDSEIEAKLRLDKKRRKNKS
ncbi:GLPGLI family protein [uncultured Nonlabens sp.]|uniref:GLPGLI family protein n=1 Tax=uncultured Nonlabens sp. TaxID=859306 RepID=UPI00262252FC|nr:GLPGLI family protein [uncultured Nonlabens sp.]